MLSSAGTPTALLVGKILHSTTLSTGDMPQYYTGGSGTLSSSCGGDSIRSSTDNLVSSGDATPPNHMTTHPPTQTTTTQSHATEQSMDFMDKLLSKQTDSTEGMEERERGESKSIENLQLRETQEMLAKERR